MKIKLLAGLFLVSIIAACTDKKGKSTDDNINSSDLSDNLPVVSLEGKWIIENIVFNDSVYVRPAEEVPGSKQYIAFTDSSYFIHTNCNTFQGEYALHGDSLSLMDGAMTEMACDNMATEEALRKIIPNIATVDIENDSITRLNSYIPSEYIVLRKLSDMK